MELRIAALHQNQSLVWLNKSRYRTLVAGRRFGKTTLAINELLQNALLQQGSLNWYVAPTYKQAKQIAWRMLSLLVPPELVVKRNESELSVVLVNGSRIELKGADNEDSLRGVGVSFVVLDEYATMKPNVWAEIIRPMLADTMGRALFIGTPKGYNHLYDVFMKGTDGEEDWASFHFSTGANPFILPSEVLAMKKEMPPAMFDQEVMASFVAEEDFVLITTALLDSLKDLDLLRPKTKRIISCDPAIGGDECVIQVIEDTVIIEQKLVNYRDTMKVAGELMLTGAKHKVTDYIIDSIGLGKGVADRLTELDMNVLFFNSSEKAIDDRFYNRRAEAYWYVMEQMRDKLVDYPSDPELRRQLTNVQYKVVSSNGRIQLEPKDKIKERIGRSPDRADAFCMGVWGLQYVDEWIPRDKYYRPRNSGYSFNPNTV